MHGRAWNVYGRAPWRTGPCAGRAPGRASYWNSLFIFTENAYARACVCEHTGVHVHFLAVHESCTRACIWRNTGSQPCHTGARSWVWFFDKAPLGKCMKWPTKTHPITITLQVHVLNIQINTIQASTCTCIINHGIYHANILFLSLKPYIHTCMLQRWEFAIKLDMQGHKSIPNIHQHAYNSSMAAKGTKQAGKTQEKVRKHLPLSMLWNQAWNH